MSGIRHGNGRNRARVKFREIFGEPLRRSRGRHRNGRGDFEDFRRKRGELRLRFPFRRRHGRGNVRRGSRRSVPAGNRRFLCGERRRARKRGSRSRKKPRRSSRSSFISPTRRRTARCAFRPARIRREAGFPAAPGLEPCDMDELASISVTIDLLREANQKITLALVIRDLPPFASERR